MEFKFHLEAAKRRFEVEKLSYAEWKSLDEIRDPSIFNICERCGISYYFTSEVDWAIRRLFTFTAIQLTDLHKRHDNTSFNDGEFWVSYTRRMFSLPCSEEICEKCLIEIAPKLLAYRDVCELDLTTDFLERAISCRKSFLKHKVKSKQQANLERCLSMPQKVFSMETWTWIEPPLSTGLQKT